MASLTFINRVVSPSILSGILCALAFVAPHYFGWLILIYCIPLLLSKKIEQESFGIYFFLGTIIFWAIHSYAIGTFSFQEYQYIGAFFFVFLVFYLSIARYLIANATIQLCKRARGNAGGSEARFVLGETIYWYIISFHIFFIFGNNTGYCCAHPALPLIDSAVIQYVISIVGSRVIIGCIMACNYIAAIACKKKNGVVIVLITLACIGMFYKVSESEEECRYARIVPPKETYLFDWIAEVHNCLIGLHSAQHRHVKTVIMPESAFPFVQADMATVCQTLNQTGILDEITFISGYHRKDFNDEIVNGLFCVNNELIIHYYDKKTLFPFTEFLPWKWLTGISERYKFGKNKKCQPSFANEIRSYSDNFLFFICSDLFFDTRLLFNQINSEQKTIIFIANDAWCENQYFRELMNRYAWLFAVNHSTQLCYVSYFSGFEYAALLKKKICLLEYI